ncbi:MAG TPA: hypothetical protein VKX16_04150 [Chloroflexota bacterium]|nr:hypothetical protein [Chloroflexota bacterium]
MQRYRSRFSLVPLVLLTVGSLVALAVSPVQAKSHASAGAKLVKTIHGHILVTPKGRTLYIFAADSPNKSSCYGECAKFWPPRLVTSGTTVPHKVSGIPGTFGVTTRTDNTQQLTYNGAPLYTFAGDKKAGDVTGEGVNASGGYWWAVVTAGR